ncbi:MAG: NHL repeat-containing protein, partial [Candidatus Krumholzibacteria bacterium]|nr:NHL repeat-containing protein [Candidatus Krumholzibacteria bacterium]
MGKSSVPTVVLILLILSGAVHPGGFIQNEDSSRVSDRAWSEDSALIEKRPAAAENVLVLEPAGIRLGAGELREPLGLAVDARGFVYVADAMTGKVFRYSTDGESVEFEKPFLSPSLYPIDVAVYGSFVYVLDYSENRVLRYDHNGAYLDILLSFDEFGKMHPSSLTAGEGGRIATTDIENHTLTIWTPLLDIELTLGGYGWSEGRMDRPMKAAILPDDRIVVVESGNRRVQLFSPAGSFEKVLSLPEEMRFRSPRSISSDFMGFIFVADT